MYKINLLKTDWNSYEIKVSLILIYLNHRHLKLVSTWKSLIIEKITKNYKG